MGTFSNTPDAKVEAHGLPRPVDTEVEPRYTDVVTRRPAVDKSEQVEESKTEEKPAKQLPKKTVRPTGPSKSNNSR